MKKTLIILPLVALIAWGLWKWKAGSAASAAPAWRRAVARRGDLVLGVQATGNVQPQNRVALRPPVPGRLEQVLVREGDWVKRGQIVAWMSSSDRAALIDAARAKGPAELKRWEELYKATPLVAPITGTVIARNAEPGQTISTGDSPLVISDRLIIKAQVDETDIARVKLGQKTVLTLDAYPDQPIPASVDHVAYEARTVNNVTIYDVEVLPASVPPFMRSGMSVGVQFETEARRGALLLPSDAVQNPGEAGAFVYVEAAPPAGAASAVSPAAAAAGGRERKRKEGWKGGDWKSMGDKAQGQGWPKGAPSAADDQGDVVVAGEPLTKAVETGLTDGAKIEIVSGLSEGEAVLVKAVSLPSASKSTNPFMPSPTRRPRGAR